MNTVHAERIPIMLALRRGTSIVRASPAYALRLRESYEDDSLDMPIVDDADIETARLALNHEKPYERTNTAVLVNTVGVFLTANQCRSVLSALTHYLAHGQLAPSEAREVLGAIDAHEASLDEARHAADTWLMTVKDLPAPSKASGPVCDDIP